MPFWQIFTPENAYTSEDKEQLSQAITSIYTEYVNLPPFYVVIVFHETPNDTVYVGGTSTNNFVRIVTDHIARQMDTVEQRTLCMEVIEQKLAPFVKERGFDWEVHLDETAMDLWRTQGLVPPPAESEMERLWAKENRPIPYEVAA